MLSVFILRSLILHDEKDIVTYDIVSQILADEVEHEEDLQALYDDIHEFIDEIKKKIT